MNKAFLKHFCCPETTVHFRPIGDMAKGNGYFLFGKDVICFGQTCSKSVAKKASGKLEDLETLVQIGQNTIALPFDLDQVVDNLRYERYASHMGLDATRLGMHRVIRDLYYLARPHLS